MGEQQIVPDLFHHPGARRQEAKDGAPPTEAEGTRNEFISKTAPLSFYALRIHNLAEYHSDTHASDCDQRCDRDA